MHRTPTSLALFAPLLVLALPGCDTPVSDSDDAAFAPGMEGSWADPTPADGARRQELDAVIDADGDGSPAGTDCDDNDATAYPGATEADDQADDDCDGWVDEDFVAVGDIVVSEINRRSLMGGASIQYDASWVEVVNTSSRTVDMANWVLSRGATAPYNEISLDAASAPILAPGDRAVFCDTDNYMGSSVAYPLTCDYVWGDEAQAASYVGTYHDNTFYLRRDKDRVAFYIAGTRTTGTLVDAVTYSYDATGGYWPRDPRFSMSLDDDYLDATLNDDINSWCSTSSSATGAVSNSATWAWYDVSGSFRDEHGTPGAANYACHGADTDGDGYTGSDDCDETDATVNIAATEVCDGIDNDCNGTVDDTSTWYLDGDGDGEGTSGTTTASCSQPSGYVANYSDCDDSDATINTAATEIDDLVDDDCDGWVDEDFVAAGDIVISEVNRRSLMGGAGVVNNASWVEVYNGSSRTVDLANWAIARGSSSPYNQIYLDPATAPVLAAGEYAVLCDSNDYEGSSVSYPLACDYVWGDEGQASTYVGTYHDNTFYIRRDADTFGLYVGGDRTTGTLVDTVTWTYDATNGYWPRDPRFSMSLDPSSMDATSNDTLDSWCSTASTSSGGVANNSAYFWYDVSASSKDEHGTPGAANYVCPTDSDGDGYDTTTDCDDANALVNPGASETCNGVDDDCDGTIDEGATDAALWYADLDSDTYGDALTVTSACDQPVSYVADSTDCDDSDATIKPGAIETCDGVDQDCDGTIDDGLATTTWYADADSDTYGASGTSQAACAQPSGYVADATDCDDADAAINPAATEVCDGVDNDCDASIDEGVGGGGTWYADADSDSYGDPGTSQTACTQPTGYVADNTDCDDASASVNPGAVEVCNDGLDNDCVVDPTACEWSGSGYPKTVYDMRVYGTAANYAVGTSIAMNGDLDGDGYDDGIIGQQYGDTSPAVDNGYVHVWYGPVSTSDALGTADLSIAGATTVNSDYFGSSVRFAGDVDGDGVDDLLGSAYKSGSDDRGTTYLFYGGTTATSVSAADASFSTASSPTNSWVGQAIDGGDVDGDGRADVLVSAWGRSTRSGNVGLWNATAIGTAEDLATDATLLVTGETAGDDLGYTASMGDLDGDGLADLILGAPASTSTTAKGKVYVFTGVSGLTGTVSASTADTVLAGTNAADRYGISVAWLGDTDLDGTNDFAVGADQADEAASNAGAAYVYTALPAGSVTGATEADTTFTGETASDYAGRMVAALGDINGDGFADLGVGATGYDPAGLSGGGALYFFYGAVATGTVSASTWDFQFTGANTSDAVGYAAAGQGDIDNDGIGDFMTSAPSWDGFGYLNAGGAWVYYGTGE